MDRVKLSVNVDHVATVREARKTNEPDPVAAAFLVELAGADGITVHLREDRRHISDRDLYLLRQIVKLELNLEMASTAEMVGIALRERPDQVTLVPEKRQEITTEGGLDAKGNFQQIAETIRALHGDGIPVSLFIDPDEHQIKAAKDLGAHAVEIHTGEYANAKGTARAAQLERIARGACLADKLDLLPRVGHGLTYQNIRDIVSIPEVREASIGHSIVARSVLVGMEQAVREMIRLLQR
jgi:pyridoxine 5-phosphate synthase